MTLFIEVILIANRCQVAHGFGAFHEKNFYKRKNAQMLLYDGGEATLRLFFAVKSEEFVLNKGESHVNRVD